MSVDTYLKGKNTSNYKRINYEGLTIMVAQVLAQNSSKVELVTKKKLVGSKLVALAHHKHTAACRHD